MSVFVATLLGAADTLFAATLATPEAPLTGEWIGEARLGGASEPIRIRWRTDGSQMHGEIDVALRGETKLPLSGLRREADRVSFESPFQGGALTFDGRLAGDRMAGRLRQTEDLGSFELVRLCAIDPRAYHAYAGVYAHPDGDFFAIAPLEDAGSRLAVLEYPSSEARILNPVTPKRFVAGPSLGAEYPFWLDLEFVTDAAGNAIGLNWSKSGATAAFAGRAVHRQEDVRFANGRVALAGTLLLPPGEGPHPAVIVLHGGGPATRRMGPVPYVFLLQGFAILTYDKRGSGESSGELAGATMADLAGDARAAFASLRRRRDIDPRRIGLFGNSNSSWIVPLVAAEERDVAFVVARAAPGLTTRENVLYEIENDLLNLGFSDAEIARALDLHRKIDATIDAGAGWAALGTAIDSAKTEAWFEPARLAGMARVSLPPDPVTLRLMHNENFDPLPAWSRVRCPALVLEGEIDRWVPGPRSAQIIRKALEDGGHRDHEVIVFARANHSFFEAETGYSTEQPSLTRFVPDYLPTTVRWLREHGKIEAAGGRRGDAK